MTIQIVPEVAGETKRSCEDRNTNLKEILAPVMSLVRIGTGRLRL